TLGAEVLRGGDDLLRKDSVGDYALLVIHVIDEKIEGRDTLFEALLDLGPFLARDGARNDVERPCAIDGPFLLVVHGEGDTHSLDRKLCRLLPDPELLATQLRQV